jgi:hypothetical protein
MYCDVIFITSWKNINCIVFLKHLPVAHFLPTLSLKFQSIWPIGDRVGHFELKIGKSLIKSDFLNFEMLWVWWYRTKVKKHAYDPIVCSTLHKKIAHLHCILMVIKKSADHAKFFRSCAYAGRPAPKLSYNLKNTSTQLEAVSMYAQDPGQHLHCASVLHHDCAWLVPRFIRTLRTLCRLKQ